MPCYFSQITEKGRFKIRGDLKMEHFEYGDRPSGPPVLGYVMLASFLSGVGLISSLVYLIVM